MNNLSKIKTNKNQILIFEVIFIVGILIYLFFSTAPKSIYPIQGMSILENDFVFEIENGEEVLISSEENFTHFFILNESSEITLPPGVYFWKVKSKFRESKIKNFTIEGKVGLKIHENEKDYELENSGNVDLNVLKKNATTISSFTLSVGDSQELDKDNSNYEGAQQ